MRYAITCPRNSETQHWRGLLRDYAVTAVMRMYVQRRVHIGACMCMRDVCNHVTV